MQKQRALLRATVSGELKDSDRKAHHPCHTPSSKSLERLLFEGTSAHTDTRDCAYAQTHASPWTRTHKRTSTCSGTHTHKREKGWSWRKKRDGAPAASSCLFLLPPHWLMSQGETKRGELHNRGNGVTWECNPRRGKKINTLLRPSGCGGAIYVSMFAVVHPQHVIDLH